MKIIAVIPARLNSSRFPEKVLYKLGGITMIERVYNAGKSCQSFDEVIVATDSTKVYDCVINFGGKAAMTSPMHQSGTERMAELVDSYPDYDVFVNLQGDQPFVTSNMLNSLLEPYIKGELLDMVTIACPLKNPSELDNPNTVKVILDQNKNALYFSRSSIPFVRNKVENLPVFHHLGLYAFSREFLQTYISLSATPFETCESLEQLRVLEHGYKIRVNFSDSYVPEINTPEDVVLAQKMNLL